MEEEHEKKVKQTPQMEIMDCLKRYLKRPPPYPGPSLIQYRSRFIKLYSKYKYT